MPEGRKRNRAVLFVAEGAKVLRTNCYRGVEEVRKTEGGIPGNKMGQSEV
ncbi:UNVERIFIED_CONTAM: hypothetical protein Sradi_4069600 [Sesamum radiatum]|uniref:Uncharacterized protein n=1 Tax=Sesamum radiatum TaxID=300843 RepID=A0AAW2PK38_SESRA